jgi:hypothetical protein
MPTVKTAIHYDCISLILLRNCILQLLEAFVKPCLLLYGCETWSMMLRKEHSLRVFENRMLRSILEPNGMK